VWQQILLLKNGIAISLLNLFHHFCFNAVLGKLFNVVSDLGKDLSLLKAKIRIARINRIKLNDITHVHFVRVNRLLLSF
jgi:hypothetical protein